ncbi:hypothetical protein CYMTET_6451 [Cymbomonas tetramitiformis]|uniref:Uncharacterized protein n=1 Tax=Cymbomonas tetramitiformis TaxID=36881 RepID=A0AAE0LIG2_9CHLO|nr:hypothetical protein CYMTET_6451 [Cymbomonas tetramitiformis]
MMEQQEDEEILQLQEAGGQHELRGESGPTAHDQQGNHPPTEVSPQPPNEEEIFERLDVLAEQQETLQEELDEEDICERLNELVEHQEIPQGELGKRRQAHHIQQGRGGVHSPCDDNGPDAQNQVEPTNA